MLRGLTTAYANVGKMLLVKGDATGLHSARILLYLVLALAVAAPHSADVAALFVCDGHKLLKGSGGVGAVSAVLGGLLKDGLGQLVEPCIV